MLEKFLKHLNGEQTEEQTDFPIKDELKVKVNTTKEIKQNNARSIIQKYNLIENQAELIKNLIG